MSASAPAFDLEGYLAHHRAGVEAAIMRGADAWTASTPEPVAAAARHGVTGGGKRLRPVLCVAAFEACGGVAEPAVYDLSAALEMVHAYSLMHDDLPCMDDAELRRGRTTTHIAHGEDVTVRAGAALIPLAALQALRACAALGLDGARAHRLTRSLLEAAGAGGMVGGQWLDLLGEGHALGPAELDGLHNRKTGALLAAALVVGGIAAGAPDRIEAALASYGRSIGLAFQITDDVLDATGSAETLGKNPSDAELDKSTYVSLYGLRDARARARSEVERGVTALADAGLDAPALRALASFVIERRK